MATLIASKQIQGVVTASVIQGDFSVGSGGSVDLSAAGGVTGSFTGSYIGDGSQLSFGGTGFISGSSQLISLLPDGSVSGSSQIDITQTDGFTSFSSSIATSLSSVDTDDQTVSFNSVSKVLTISEGNSVDLSSLGGGGGGGGSSIWSTGSSWYFVSADFKVTGSFDATSLTGSIDYSNLTNVPTLISGSSQITSSLDSRYALSGSGGGGGDVTHLNTFTSSIQTEVDGLSAATSSYITSIPSGTVSGSIQILGGTDLVSSSKQITDLGFISSSDSTTSINTFTSSIQTEVDAISAATSSYLTSAPAGTISGSKQVTDLGFISSSDSTTSLNQYTSSTDTRLSGIDTITSSLDGRLDNVESTTSSLEQRVGQIESNTGSYDDQTVISSLNTFTGSYYNDSASFQTQITTEKGRVDAILTSADADKDSFAEIVTLINQVDTSNDNAFAAHYTSSRQRDTALEAFTSSIQTEVNLISAATSSYLTQVPAGTVSGSIQILGGTDLVSSSAQITALGFVSSSGDSTPAGTISGSKQITDLGFISSSDSITSLNTFTSSIDTTIKTKLDGDGVISGSSQLTGSYDNRYVINQAPTATFTNQTTNFNTNLATNGKTMVSASVSDTESDTPFSASLGGTNASSFNLVYSNAASSSIGIHANGNLSAANYSYNVSIFDSFGKSTTYSRTLEVTQADTGTLGGDTTSYIIESAVSGAVIRDATGFGGGNPSQVTVSYSPNHGSQAVSTFSSLNPAIGIDNSGNLKIARNLKGSGTGSGDTIVSAVTFTDQYGNSGTSNVTVNVFDNHHPSASFTDVTDDMNTNEASGGVDLVNVTISDTESDTPFSASLSGSDASSFQIQYNNSNSSSLDIQAASDLAAKEYNYTLSVFDNFGKSSSYNRSLIISQSNVGTLGTNGTFYVIESAVNSNNVVTNSNGRTGTQGDLGVTYSPNYGSQVVQEFTSSNALISVSSGGALTVGSNISGSGETSGDTINSNITFADQYGNVGSGSISVNVTTNNAPDIIFNNSSLLNTNQASGSSGTLVTLTFSDTESDTIDYDGVTFSDSSNQLTFTQNSNTWLVKANSQLSASNYTFSASVDDVHSFRTNTEGHTISITQSPTGSLNGDTTMYILESTGSGAPFRDATGYENGNLAQIGVTYSPNHGSAAVKTFSSKNPAISIDNSGNLTLGVNLSGSATQSGDTISSVITYTDQYGNVGNEEVTATVFGNQAPAASFTKTGGYETDDATSGSDAGALVVTDVESNSPFTVTLAGTDGGKFDVSGSTSPFEIQPTGSLVAGTYSINIVVTDSYSESVTLSNQSIAVTQSLDFGKVYIYYSNYGSDSGLSSNYNSVMGISTVNGSTPPEVTAFTANDTSPFRLISSSLGETTLSLAGGANATKAAEVSGSDLNTVISQSAAAMSWANGVQTIIIVPSGSDMIGIPTSMTDSFGGSTTGQYVLVEYADGTSAPLGATNSTIHLLDTSGSINGYDKHFVIGAKAQNSATTMRLKVLAVSGSLGAF